MRAQDLDELGNRDLQEVFNELLKSATEKFKTAPRMDIEDISIVLDKDKGETYAIKIDEGPKPVLTAFVVNQVEKIGRITKTYSDRIETELSMDEVEPMLEILRKYKQPGDYKPTILEEILAGD